MNRVKTTLFLLFLSILASCNSYISGDLNGKWTTTIENNKYDLWIKDTLALGFDHANQILTLYRLTYNREYLIFTNIEPFKDSTFKEKVLNLSSNRFTVQLMNQNNKQITIYLLDESGIPNISSDNEVNFELYKNRFE